jgi:hypothetical protein
MAVIPIGGLVTANPGADTDSIMVSQVPGGGGVNDPLKRMTLLQLQAYVRAKQYAASYHFSNISTIPGTGMVGLGGSVPGQGQNAIITPSTSGRVLFHITGTFPPNNVGSTVSLQYGSGTPPNVNAAQTGTQIAQSIAPSGVAAHPITLVGLATGLTLGVAYWFDLYFVLANSSYGSVLTFATTAVEV